MNQIDKRKLRAALALRGTRQSAAAEAVGVSPSQLSRAIQGTLKPEEAARLRASLESFLGLGRGALATPNSKRNPFGLSTSA